MTVPATAREAGVDGHIERDGEGAAGRQPLPVGVAALVQREGRADAIRDGAGIVVVVFHCGRVEHVGDASDGGVSLTFRVPAGIATPPVFLTTIE